MKLTLNILFAAILSLGVLVSCSDNATSPNSGDNGSDNNSGNQQNEVTTGVLETHISTTGSDFDSDGYTLVVDGSGQENATIEDTLFFSDMEEGSHEIELTESADNCGTDGDNPKSFDITAGDTTTVSFTVTCESLGAPPLVNMIAYESSGEGGGYSKIYVMEADGSNPQMLYEIDGKNALQPDISPDGKSIVFSGGGFDNYIYVMGSDGSNVTQLTTDEDDADDYNPVWSPDGTQIAFERDQDIYVMNADGTEQQNITNTPDYFEEDPAWAPDGDQIAYVRGVDDTYNQDEGNIFIMNADGSEPYALTEVAENIDREPAWSPDGTQIAFARRPDGDVFEIFVIDADASNLQQITHMPNGASTYASRAPAWSPDGSRIAFTSSNNGTFIHIINTDGSNEITLDNNGTINHGNSDWSPIEE